MPKISVIVPHYHDLAGLGRCLTALENQTFPRTAFEVVVADNASPEGEAVVARAVGGRARLVVVHDRGAGPARNGGVAAARNEILAFIDSDCVADPNWLAEGSKALSNYDFVGGRVRVLVDDERQMTGAEAFERVFAFDFETYITKKGFTGSGNLFCTRAVFDHVGGFRAGVSEDVDWSHRARSMGYRLGYAPLAVVGHPARRDWHALQSKWRRLNRETFSLYLTKPAGRLKWILRNALLPLSAVVHIPRVLRSGELNSLQQRRIALATLFRLRMWRLADSLRLAMLERGA